MSETRLYPGSAYFREVELGIQRMSQIIKNWKTLVGPDRQFLLRKFRDEYPQDFWVVANENERQV